MIDRQALLKDLQRLLRTLEADLRERCDEVAEVGAAVRAEYDAAKEAERTAQTFEAWRADYITQIAAAWVLSCVFARFLEDNELVDPPRIAGPGDRLRRARDEHELHFRNHPTDTDREYLLSVFDALAKLPGGRDIFGEHNAVHQQRGWLSGDAAKELLGFFQRIEPESGKLVHDFTDPEWDTRFLGDLYQDLSEAARKKYALLQTPDFVEEFILDRTLDPAVEEFGLKGFRMIDPACGSGHFLLGSFQRLFDGWCKAEPGTNVRELVQRALDSVHGVDINPFAVAIARFRLLLVSLKACEITRLANAPAFEFNLACGDSLYHGREKQMLLEGIETDESHYFRAEDAQELRQILREGTYHCVVANPPYITPKDKAANDAYRRLYSTCHRKYSLAVPFMERIFRLAVQAGDDGKGGGYTGQITANSFMKREFGKKLIEEFFRTIDLTHVVDTSGAFIPGHATPTVILFGRNRCPIAKTVRAVMGIGGEPTTPDEPGRGLVWSAIVTQIDQAGSRSKFISVADSDRPLFQKHPWSIGGDGGAELRIVLEKNASLTLRDVIDDIGVFGITAADEVMLAPKSTFRRTSVDGSMHRRLVVGDEVRDWQCADGEHVWFPYADGELVDLQPETAGYRWLWANRTSLWSRQTFARKTYQEEGRTWWEWHQTTLHRLETPLTIILPFVASHNHFFLDHGGKVYNRSAPVIKLRNASRDEDFFAVLGLLNSSTVCFWLKQVSQQKQMSGGESVRIESVSKVPYEFSSTQIQRIPVPARFGESTIRDRLIAAAKKLDELGRQQQNLNPNSVIVDTLMNSTSIRDGWERHIEQRAKNRSMMIFLQEELDFIVYVMFGLLPVSVLTDYDESASFSLEAGQRPFEIACGSNPEGFSTATAPPADWPEWLRTLWEQRLVLLRTTPQVAVIEGAHYKRRWIGRQGKYNHTKRADEFAVACESWLLDRLETYFDFDGRMNEEGKPTAQVDIRLISVARLADIAARDSNFTKVAECYRGRQDFDVGRLVAELVEDESVPLLPVLRYKPAGIDKRTAWERTWELQRQEDAIDARTELSEDDPNYLTEDQAKAEKQRQVGNIPVPPKYKSSDFQKASYWRLRGKLDVPKERWVSFPHCEGDDQTLMVAWAGYDHLQLARAVAAYFAKMQEEIGGSDDPRLVPLLGCILELLRELHRRRGPNPGPDHKRHPKLAAAKEDRPAEQKELNRASILCPYCRQSLI